MFAPSSAPEVCLERVVAEHLANATQLFASLSPAYAPSHTVDTFADLCLRCEANLDALRIAGAAGLRIAQDALDDDPDAAAVVAYLLAASARARADAAGLAVGILGHASPDVRRAARWGLRLAPVDAIESRLRALLGGETWDAAAAAALDVLAFHRVPARVTVPAAARADDDDIPWLLAEAGGRLPGAWTAAHLAGALDGPSPRVRDAALRASARSGLPQLAATCRAATERAWCPEAVAFLGVVGAEADVPRLQRAAAHPSTAHAAVAALGRLGLPSAMPSLLYFLDVPEVAESAAAAIARITGREVPRDQPPPPPAELTEDERDLWEPVPPVDVAGARRWWQAEGRRFDPARHYQNGLCVSDDPLGAVFDQLPLHARYDVYLRQRALVHGTPDWELETWSWKQRNPGG